MSREPIGVAAFVTGLVSAVPALTPVYEEHLGSHHEMLPYVLLDEISRYVLAGVRPPHPDHVAIELLERFAAAVEEAFGSADEDVQTLIRTTFLESVDALWRQERAHRLVVSRLGPLTREWLSVDPGIPC